MTGNELIRRMRRERLTVAGMAAAFGRSESTIKRWRGVGDEELPRFVELALDGRLAALAEAA